MLMVKKDRDCLRDSSKDGYNIGFCILRMIMCFCVILCHFGNSTNSWGGIIPFMAVRGYAVPVFMMLSFLLMQKNMMKKDTEIIKKRLFRLLIPHLGWAVIYWVIYEYLMETVTGMEITNGISDLIWQLCTGHSPNVNATMWYQVVLMVLSALYFLLFYFLPENIGMLCIFISMILSLILQYSGLNYDLFSGLRYELRYPLGRTVEMIPYAMIGFSLSYYDVYRKLKKHKKTVMALSVIIFVIATVVDHIWSKVRGFDYAGIPAILIAFSLITIAQFLPLNDLIGSGRIRRLILILSRYTLGIYCVHRLVGDLYTYMFDQFSLKPDSSLLCVLIYITGYILSAIVAKFPLKVCRQLVE